jgi:hypothetical protein
MTDTITLRRADAEQIRAALVSGEKLFAALAALDAALAEPDAIAKAVEAEKHRAEVAISTLSYWFNLSEKAESEGASVLNDALETYLRRSINGGMPEEHEKIVRKVVDDAARIYLWKALVPVIRGIAATTAQPDAKREPATDEQVTEAYIKPGIDGRWRDFELGFRAAERFHGIKKEGGK